VRREHEPLALLERRAELVHRRDDVGIGVEVGDLLVLGEQLFDDQRLTAVANSISMRTSAARARTRVEVDRPGCIQRTPSTSATRLLGGVDQEDRQRGAVAVLLQALAEGERSGR